jgi:hypothetical protein
MTIHYPGQAVDKTGRGEPPPGAAAIIKEMRSSLAIACVRLPAVSTPARLTFRRAFTSKFPLAPGPVRGRRGCPNFSLGRGMSFITQASYTDLVIGNGRTMTKLTVCSYDEQSPHPFHSDHMMSYFCTPKYSRPCTKAPQVR